jgi:hypothetical protein
MARVSAPRGARVVQTNQRTETKDEMLAAETGIERKTGLFGPAGWRWIGLAVLAVLIAIVLVLKMAGGDPGTSVVPGTPIAAPQSASAIQ